MEQNWMSTNTTWSTLADLWTLKIPGSTAPETESANRPNKSSEGTTAYNATWGLSFFSFTFFKFIFKFVMVAFLRFQRLPFLYHNATVAKLL